MLQLLSESTYTELTLLSQVRLAWTEHECLLNKAILPVSEITIGERQKKSGKRQKIFMKKTKQFAVAVVYSF